MTHLASPPLTGSQMRTVLSYEQLAAHVLPLASKKSVTPATLEKWPSSKWTANPQMRTVLSNEQLANHLWPLASTKAVTLLTDAE